MLRISLFFLLISAVFANYVSVPSVDSQCATKRHVGACYMDETRDWAARCTDLKCATGSKVNNEYSSVYIGPAAKGTICGVSQACDANKKCVRTFNVPHQVGPNAVYKCQ